MSLPPGMASFNRAFNLASLSVALFLLPLIAHAAGFDCAKAASATEKAICADAALSRQDEELTRLWQTHVQTGDTTALQAQHDWLRQRNRCGGDAACLTQSYTQRLGALRAAPAMPTEASAPWRQTWHLEQLSDSAGSTLKISGARPLHFNLHGWNGGNSGTLEGDAVQDAHSHARYDKDGCQLDFQLQGDALHVEEKETGSGDCGAGMGVDYAGRYTGEAQYARRQPADLHSLGIVASATDDTALRKLLGKEDYQVLLDDANSHESESTAGTRMTRLWVRGIANSNAAIVMSRAQQDFWVGLLIFDAHQQLRMRYYTNVAQDKRNVPRPIRDWRDGIDPHLPIDLMP